MTFAAFFLILFSVMFHAVWNLLAKKSSMSTAYYTLICVTTVFCSLHIQFWTPVQVFDLPWNYYLFMSCSVVSDVLYCMGLVRAYRTMEMSTAYPMMRALPLLLTAGITTLFGFGKPLSPMAMAGMAVVFSGCLLMPLPDFKSFNVKSYFNCSLFFIIWVAFGTTGYTIFDKQAQNVMCEAFAHVSKPVLALTYYSCRGIMLATILLTIVLAWRKERMLLREYIAERNYTPFLAGLFATCSYSLVLIAMNYVDNVSYVQAFRQLGLILGVAGGIIILKEKCAAPKICGSILIVSGLLMSVL